MARAIRVLSFPLVRIVWRFVATFIKFLMNRGDEGQKKGPSILILQRCRVFQILWPAPGFTLIYPKSGLLQ